MTIISVSECTSKICGVSVPKHNSEYECECVILGVY